MDNKDYFPSISDSICDMNANEILSISIMSDYLYNRISESLSVDFQTETSLSISDIDT